MTPSVKSFLTEIIDYAGLFPPARLPMDEAIASFARHADGPDAWLLARFVCPAARLADLDRAGDLFFSGHPSLAVAALGRGGDTIAAFLAGARADADDVAALLAARRGRVVVDQFEVRLCAEALESGHHEAAARVIAESAAILAGAGGPLTVAVELPIIGAEPGALDAAVAAIARAKETGAAANRWSACVKLRCGGLSAAAIPTVDELANAVVLACRHDVPIKATQGLHHPVRRDDPSLGAATHGFLNLFAAGMLLRAGRVDEAGVRAALDERDPDAFRFDEAGFSWRGHRLTPAEIARERGRAVTSFGSCSFLEPRDDLRALGLLDTPDDADPEES